MGPPNPPPTNEAVLTTGPSNPPPIEEAILAGCRARVARADHARYLCGSGRRVRTGIEEQARSGGVSGPREGDRFAPALISLALNEVDATRCAGVSAETPARVAGAGSWPKHSSDGGRAKDRVRGQALAREGQRGAGFRNESARRGSCCCGTIAIARGRHAVNQFTSHRPLGRIQPKAITTSLRARLQVVCADASAPETALRVLMIREPALPAPGEAG